MTKLVKAFRDISIILAITCAMILIAELVMRIVYPEEIKAHTSLAYEFNEDFLVSLKPNITKEFVREEVNGGYLTSWNTNADSFRGSKLEESPGYRIIVYGDSNIQARFSGIKRTFPERLAFYLNQIGVSDVEVINGGVVGFGPDQALIRFTQEADRYNPDLVIFHVFADNDFGDILRNRLFSQDAKGNLISTDYNKTLDSYLLANDRDNIKSYISELLIVRMTKKAVLEMFDADEVKNKQSKEELVTQLQEIAEAEYLVYKNSQPQKFSHFRDHYDIDVALFPDGESANVKRRLMEGVLTKADILARNKGIEFLVLIQPSVVDMTKDNAALNYEFLQKFPGYKPSNLSDEVANICRSNNIKAINLFDLFNANHPEDLFFKGDNDHWTDLGQNLAAKETARYLIGHSMIK